MTNQWAGVTPEERFWRKVIPSEVGCWGWDAAHDTRGYGLLWLNGRFIGAHRFAYQTFVGPIPEGLELDHLCRNKGCVNPAHVEPVTHLENMRRSIPHRTFRGPAPKSHCPQGHPYGDARDSRGRRTCRICRRADNAVYRARKRSQQAGLET